MSEEEHVHVHPRTQSSTPEGGEEVSTSSEMTPSSSSNPSVPPPTQISLIQRAVEACQKGVEEELVHCLKQGIKPNDVDGDGCSLLHWAAINNHEKVIKRLLSEGADVNILGGILVSAPLHWAARVGNLNACAVLARAGARCDVRDTQGYTPMHLAVQGCFTPIVAYFIHHYDYAVNVTDNSGMTSAMWCSYRNYDMFPLRLLVRAGADLRIAESLQGNTALHLACQERNLTAVKELLSGGVDVMATNNQQETPLDIARNTRNAKIIKLLESHARRRGSISSSCIKSFQDNQPFVRTLQFLGPSMFFCVVFLSFYWMHPAIALVVLILAAILLRMKLDIHRITHTLIPIGITVAEALAMLSTWSLSPQLWVPWWAHILFLLCMATLFGSLIRCALCDAGSIPPSTRPYEEFKQLVDEKRLSYFCYTCFVNRPVGSKHCAVCDKCVVNFDHHCPWLNACITRRNHREFLLFVLSVGLTSLVFAGSLIAFFSFYLREHPFKELAYNYPWEIFTLFLACLHVILMSSLFGVQAMQIAQGVTTNQMLKRQSYPRQSTREGHSRMGDEESGGHSHHHDDGHESGCVFYIRNCLNFCAGQ
ncbi:hypothetical protein PMAYCL1PPCAC_02721 [Pristionchus mayeri]|uniref:Palmitoyltransferase n=1 Tax=Pristionchus mayeri TaxID=1317129 RepID=A0AAN5C8R9_9BILA|nr:hypothetical protein PMAYCL1PPCAC_02721 [Pristionchus mayeri]